MKAILPVFKEALGERLWLLDVIKPGVVRKFTGLEINRTEVDDIGTRA